MPITENQSEKNTEAAVPEGVIGGIIIFVLALGVSAGFIPATPSMARKGACSSCIHGVDIGSRRMTPVVVHGNGC